MSNIASGEWRRVDELRGHPDNAKIYGDLADPELVASVRDKGILNPLLITYDNRIISGHRRWDAARVAELGNLPVVVFASQDELDIRTALIESNRQRQKTNEQLGREFDALKEIEAERAKRRQATSTGGPEPQLVEYIPQAEAGKSRDKAAEKLGVSGRHAEKAAQVVNTIDDLKEQGREDEAEALRQTLNERSVSSAYNKAKERGYISNGKPKPQPQIKDFIRLAEWEAMSDADRFSALNRGGNKQFNSTNDNVEWALWTWNAITGCLHGCEYCYAREIAHRFYQHLDEEERFSPVFYPDRITAPANTKQPNFSKIADPIERLGKRNVFVCSMADLFGKWVPTEWIEAVLQQAWDNPQWNFLFLTKFPIRMAEFRYPDNAWIGTTVDKQWAVDRAEKAFTKIRAGGYGGVAWLSCEPMLEQLKFNSLEMFDWVVIGGSSGSDIPIKSPVFKPPISWTFHLVNQAKRHDLPVYMKTNLGIEEESRDMREYPVSLE